MSISDEADSAKFSGKNFLRSWRNCVQSIPMVWQAHRRATAGLDRNTDIFEKKFDESMSLSVKLPSAKKAAKKRRLL